MKNWEAKKLRTGWCVLADDCPELAGSGLRDGRAIVTARLTEPVAKLIAASPKLLEACRLAAILCDDYADGAPDSTPFSLECNRVGEVLDAAIAAATD